MAKRSFVIFDQVLGEIVRNVDDATREAVKRRVNFELDQYESQAGSTVHQMFIATGKRIREIERKALARTGKPVPPRLEQGRQCTLCGNFESDVRVVPLGEKHAICAECIVLVKQIVDEDGKRSGS